MRIRKIPLVYRININFAISCICLFILCVPRNTSAFPRLCWVLNKVDLLCVAWALYVFLQKKIYNKKWLYPMWLLLVAMMVSTLFNDIKFVWSCFIQAYTIFAVVVISEYLMIFDWKKGLKWIAFVWGLFLFVQCYSLLTGCFGYTSTNNTKHIPNFFFGIRVEINQYIIYTMAFCLFSVYTKRLNRIYAYAAIAAGLYFVMVENVSTSVVGVALFAVTFVVAKIIRSERMWRNMIFLLVSFVFAFAFVRNTAVFEWLIVGVLKEEVTLNNRTVLWEQAIMHLGHYKWLLGYGYNPPFILRLSSTYAVNHPHNQFLQMLFNYGIGALAAYLLLFYNMIKQIKVIKNQYFKTVHIAALSATIVMCMVSRNFFYLTAPIYYVISAHLNKLESK